MTPASIKNSMDPVSSAPTLGRRELLSYSAAFGAAFMAKQGLGDEPPVAAPPRQSVQPLAPKRYDMKKAINMWAFAYPEKWSLQESLQLAKDAGFDGVELNFDLRQNKGK